MELTQKQLDDIKNVIKIQTSDPYTKKDSYMQGMANGMLVIDAIIHSYSPVFIDHDKDEIVYRKI